MKDIELNNPLLRIQYSVSWILFFLFGGSVPWIIAIFLAYKGKTNSKNTPYEKDILNKTWQKFIFSYGFVVTHLFLIAFLLVIWGVLAEVL